MRFRWKELTFATITAFGGAAQAAVVQQAHYALGESGSVGASSPYTSLVDSISGKDMAFFQSPGGNTQSITSPGVGGAPGSTAALTLTQSPNRNAGWGGTTGFNLSTDWVLQLWFKTPDATTTSNSYLFLGTNSNSATSLSLELNNNHVNVLTSNNTAARLTGFAYTTNTWMKITLMNYDGTLYLYDGATLAAQGVLAGATLNDIRLGFGTLAAANRGAAGSWDEMSVWSFDHATDSLASVLATSGVVAAPTPAALPASLLLLGAMGLKRRRA